MLGQLAEDERDQLEEKMMADNEFYDSVLLAEDDLIEEYVESDLPEGDRAEFEAAYLSTPEGRRRISYANAMHKYAEAKTILENDAQAEASISATKLAGSGRLREPTKPVPEIAAQRDKTMQSRWWRRRISIGYVAAAAVIVIGVAFGIWRVFIFESDVTKGTKALALAYREQRPFEARISGLTYAPALTTRGGEPKVDPTARNLAESILLEAVLTHPSATTHYAAGRLYLAEKNFDEAIKQFEEANEPNNAQLQSDYGAALLEYGIAFENNEDGSAKVEAFARSLEHLNRALSINPSLHEALFNRAILHQQMMLLDRAAEDWHTYLEQDPQGPWAAEARQYLEQLEEHQSRAEQNRETLTENFLRACRGKEAEQAWALFSPNREKLIGELLATYLDSATDSSNTAGREALGALAYAGELDERRCGDHYTADMARFYRTASRQQLPAARVGSQLMRQAQEAYDRANVNIAAGKRAEARAIFMKIGDQCDAQLATYWLALHLWEQSQIQQSQAMFDPLLRACQANQHLWLYARSLHQQAGIAFKRNGYSSSIAYEDEARRMAERFNDVWLICSARSAAIDHYRFLGNRDALFRQIAAGWGGLGTSSLEPLALWRQYDTLAQAFTRFAYFDAAIDCALEALKFAARIGEFVTVSYSQTNLGMLYGKAQRFDDAFSTVQRAYEAASAAADPAVGHLMQVNTTVQMGHLHRARGEFAEARGQYDHALELYNQYNLRDPSNLYQTRKGRLACYLALDDTAAAQQELALLLPMMDEYRAKIIEVENRDNFFDGEQSVYDLGIELAAVRLQDWPKAFDYAEESRARSLLDLMNANARGMSRDGKPGQKQKGETQPLPLSEIQSRLPADARLLEYAVLDNQLLIWVVAGDDTLQHAAVPVTQADLTETVLRFRAALQSDTEAAHIESRRLARELFRRLIAPIADELVDSHRLFIVPDKVLCELPWDALTSTDGRVLLEKYLLMLSPSASSFARCTEIAAQKDDGRDERILAIGNPSFDRTAFPRLESLGAAESEARTIASLYAAGPPLIGLQARESAVCEALAGVDILQFAGHCLIDERSPMRSSLLLARESSGGASAPDGLLQAQEICGLRMPRLRLAVLSACQTGVERYYGGEGMIGMARAFLAARVPLVVASLWPVDSAPTARLMIEFHENRRHGMHTAEALREAKRGLLRKSEDPYRDASLWAAFAVIGGQANF